MLSHRLVSSVYKQCLKLNKKTTQFLKWTQHFNRPKHVQMVQHLKRCSMSVIREMQMKTTFRYHLTPIKMEKVKD